MSHGKIYQLATKPISRDDYMEPDDFYENHDAYADWIGDAEEGEEREELIADFAKYDLKGLFEYKDGCLVYLGEGNYLKQWVDAIREKASAITVENVVDYAARADLRDVLSGTHASCMERVVIEEYTGRYAEPLAELITFAKKTMKPGDKLYIGAVIDYHY